LALTRIQERADLGEVSSKKLAQAYVNTYRTILQEGGKLTPQQEKHYQQLTQQIGAARRLEQSWRNISRQISTIISDFGRGVIDIFFPKAQQKQEDPFTNTLRDGLTKLSQQGFDKPVEGLGKLIEQIKSATNVVDANRIAVRAFGSAGPELAKALRDGSLSGERLAKALQDASDASKGIEEGSTRVSKFKALLLEVRSAILRVFVEEGARALADFTGKHLKNLLKGLDDILFKIPGIGKALEAVFGKLGGTPGIKTPPIPGAPLPIPGGPQIPGAPPIPGTPPIPGGGAGSAAAGFAGSTLNAVLGLVIGGVTAASSVISNFQQRAMNKALDNIVLHTLQTANDLANLRADNFTLHQQKLVKLDDLWKTLINIETNLVNGFSGVTVGGGGGSNTYNIYFGGQFAGTGNGEIMALADQMVGALRRSGIRPRSA
jgi:hypothetical protein